MPQECIYHTSKIWLNSDLKENTLGVGLNLQKTPYLNHVYSTKLVSATSIAQMLPTRANRQCPACSIVSAVLLTKRCPDTDVRVGSHKSNLDIIWNNTIPYMTLNWSITPDRMSVHHGIFWEFQARLDNMVCALRPQGVKRPACQLPEEGLLVHRKTWVGGGVRIGGQCRWWSCVFRVQREGRVRVARVRRSPPLTRAGTLAGPALLSWTLWCVCVDTASHTS